MKTVSKKRFDQLVSDFEHGIIDGYAIDGSVIAWSEKDQTCLESVNGRVVATGSFQHLLEWWLPASQEAAE